MGECVGRGARERRRPRQTDRSRLSAGVSYEKSPAKRLAEEGCQWLKRKRKKVTGFRVFFLRIQMVVKMLLVRL
uniref:Uncharacterized protein n=1 Tax=Cucumis melo TaxID=3656 RepID=A0A9I9D265_CUCME